MTWVIHSGLEAANLTIVVKHCKIAHAESCESIKLGIYTRVKWYYAAQQLVGAFPQDGTSTHAIHEGSTEAGHER